ncbi:AAA family ATPase [Nocardioides sp. GXZ039]|uniref:AAA family ATPase n=1 Tax=Nocardioides sp. GXZ039 TaxID=3136018 RepID=UPI0030F3CE35
MPVLVETDSAAVSTLLGAMPPGAQAVSAPDRMLGWLDQHPDEYVVVLGPSLPLETALQVCQDLSVDKPVVSVVLAVDSPDAHVLAGAMKAGARDVVAAGDPGATAAAIQRAHQLAEALRGPSGARHLGRIVSIFSPKGGVGKTTIAVNVALALAEGGARKVCLVDLDLGFGDVAITTQVFATNSIEQAIGAEDQIDLTMVQGLLTRHQDSLMILAAPPHPDARDRVTPTLVTRILRALREGFDYVVIDLPPSFDDQVLTALDETDECVIVTTLDVPTLKNVKLALETLEVLSIANGHRHLVLNRADDAVGIGPAEVESILGMPITARLATSIDVAAATNAGTPIMLQSPRHPASVAIRGLASALAGQPVGAPLPLNGSTAGPGTKRRLFRRRRKARG